MHSLTVTAPGYDTFNKKLFVNSEEATIVVGMSGDGTGTDSITHEIILSFLGRVQLEVVSALLAEKYKIETAVKEPTVIYLERPLKAANHTIHIEVPPNPFWASIGLSVTPLPLGSGVYQMPVVSSNYWNIVHGNTPDEVVKGELDAVVKEVGAKITDADGLIVGSPVYYASPTGEIMMFLDTF